MVTHSWHNPNITQIFAGFIHRIASIHAITDASVIAIATAANVELVITLKVTAYLSINTLET